MANNNIVPTALVRELLGKDNYDHWSIQVETYLVAQDLWDVVEAPIPGETKTEADKSWYKRNAAALHAIQISCSSDTFNLIRKIRVAKEAWDTLTTKFSDSSSPATNKEEGAGRRHTRRGGAREEGLEEENVDETGEEGQEEENVDEIGEKSLEEEIVDETGEEGQEEENVDQTGEEGQEEENVDETGEESEEEEIIDETVNLTEYTCFFNDVGEGNCEAVEKFLTQHDGVVRVKSPNSRRTALHVAVSFGRLQIVEKLVNLMTAEELEIVDCDGFTAFLIAVHKGNVSMVECMLKNNANLLSIYGKKKDLPVLTAINSGQKEMARYLYRLTEKRQILQNMNDCHGASLLFNCIFTYMFDIAMDLIKHQPHLVRVKDYSGRTSVEALAIQRDLFTRGFQLRFWQRWIYNFMHVPSQHATKDVRLNIQNDGELDSTSNKWSAKFVLGIEHIYKLKVVHTQASELLSVMCKEIKTLDEAQIKEDELTIAIETAATLGTVEFIKEISKAIPKTMWTYTFLLKVFGLAIQNRQPKVFSLIHGIDYKQGIASVRNSNQETLLHIAGYIASSEKLNLDAGPALQMQRELQWFKEVESITSEAARRSRNKEDKIPRKIFTESHENLMIDGEKWMKNISSSCSFVGALIFTIMFTAAFTLPGGNNQNTGFPMFIDKKLFKIFIISDAISLFCSTTSVLTFLGILTSRYAEDDFLMSLPRKMILGLSTLFLSIATMMISFCAAVALLFDKQLWIVAPIILIACIPVTLFVFLQFPLLVNIFKSTYGRSIFDRKVENWLG
ncbi:hypothetical protein UlMin_024976, partial [Ulmus minor]